MTSLPLLEIRLKDGSDGHKTVERDYLVFTKLQRYDSHSESDARDKTISDIDNLITQLLVIRACL